MNAFNDKLLSVILPFCHSEHLPVIISLPFHFEHLPVICSASETDTLIEFQRNVLNEVKNHCSWLSHCYNEILHFVQNDRYPVCHWQAFVSQRTTEILIRNVLVKADEKKKCYLCRHITKCKEDEKDFIFIDNGCVVVCFVRGTSR